MQVWLRVGLEFKLSNLSWQVQLMLNALEGQLQGHLAHMANGMPVKQPLNSLFQLG